MPKFSHLLNYTEVNYGLLLIPEYRNYFPAPSQPIIIIDPDGESFVTKMHNTQSRIDGLTKLHKKYETQIGNTVVIEVNPNNIGTANVFFEKTSSEKPEAVITPTEKEEGSLLIPAPLESMLEDVVVNYLNKLEPNLKLFKDEDGILGRGYPTDAGIIDLLCVDEKNNFVVIELKRGRENDKVVGQISRYIGWVKANLAKDSTDVRGIVIVHKPTEKYPKDEKLYYAILRNPKLELRYYEISLNFYERGKEF